MENFYPASALLKLNLSYKKRNSAFTLIEVVITIAIVVMVMTVIYFSVVYGAKSTAVTRVQIVKEQELMKIFYQMRKQLTNLYIKENMEPLIGVKGMMENHDEIYFLTTSLNRTQGVGEVGYKVKQKEDGTYYLAYTEFPYPRMKEPFALVNPLDKWRSANEIIRGMKIEYRENKKWLPQWKRRNAPERIRITLFYNQDENQEMKSFTFIVVPGVSAIF